MQNNERARQFLPFDALKGFREALREKEKEVVKEKILSSDDEEELNRIINNIKENTSISILCYSAGQYEHKKGIVTKIDKANKYIQIDKCKISFSTIKQIEIF